MSQLVLIKHAAVTVDAAVPSKQWPLNDAGRALCRPLATLLRGHDLGALVSSTEPKAIETAELLAKRLRIPATTGPDLDEHRRPYAQPGEFEAQMERFFAQPSQRVYGEESAEEALHRFQAAIEAALAAHTTEGNLGIVSHGTVIALYAAPFFGIGAAAMWNRLSHPAFVAIDTETGIGLRIVDDVE